MRILHVVRQFAPGSGGLGNYVAELAKTQGEAGHHPMVLTLDRLFSDPDRKLPRFEHTDAYEIRHISYFGSRRYPIAPSVFRHLRDCDVVHVHGIDFFFDALAWSRFWHRRPLVATTHGGFFHTTHAAGLKDLYFETVTRASLRAYGAILATSARDRNIFQRISARPIDLVEKGIDTDRFADRGSPSFRKHILSIGSLTSSKRLVRLIDFLRDVRAKDPEWSLTFCGVERDVKAADLARYAAARGLASSINLRMDLSNDELASEIRRASFIADASDREEFGIAVIKGMSAGLIPLMSDILRFRRLYQQSGAGLLLDFGNPKRASRAFLGAAEHLAVDYPHLRACARHAAKIYAWPSVAKQIDGVYERVIGEHRPSVFGAPALVPTGDDTVLKLNDKLDAGRTTKAAFPKLHTANIAPTDSKLSHALYERAALNDGIGVSSSFP